MQLGSHEVHLRTGGITLSCVQMQKQHTPGSQPWRHTWACQPSPGCRLRCRASSSQTPCAGLVTARLSDLREVSGALQGFAVTVPAGNPTPIWSLFHFKAAGSWAKKWSDPDSCLAVNWNRRDLSSLSLSSFYRGGGTLLWTPLCVGSGRKSFSHQEISQMIPPHTETAYIN